MHRPDAVYTPGTAESFRSSANIDRGYANVIASRKQTPPTADGVVSARARGEN